MVTYVLSVHPAASLVGRPGTTPHGPGQTTIFANDSRGGRENHVQARLGPRAQGRCRAIASRISRCHRSELVFFFEDHERKGYHHPPLTIMHGIFRRCLCCMLYPRPTYLHEPWCIPRLFQDFSKKRLLLRPVTRSLGANHDGFFGMEGLELELELSLSRKESEMCVVGILMGVVVEN